MTGGRPYLLHVRLTVTASDSGIFLAPELLVWLRAVSLPSWSVPRPGKVFVVQPDKLIFDADSERARTYRADELSVTPERVDALVGVFTSLGFPGRPLEIEDSSDPETTWSARATLEVELDEASGRLVIDLGPDGVCGRDAAAMKNVFRALFECAGVQSYWSDLLAGRAETGA
jgi:hypothetical protein